MARRPWGSPAQVAALEKARAVSARNRHARARANVHRFYGHDPVKRGQGIEGLKRNFVPYGRVNKRSQTGGFNVGTIIPGTKKRIVLGGYVRVENTTRKGAIDRALGRAAFAVAPHGTTRGKVRTFLHNNVEVKNPAIRVNTGAGQARLGTSRGAGPTIIVRRGRHKTPEKRSRSGVQRYSTGVKTRARKRGKRSRSALMF